MEGPSGLGECQVPYCLWPTIVGWSWNGTQVGVAGSKDKKRSLGQFLQAL